MARAGKPGTKLTTKITQKTDLLPVQELTEEEEGALGGEPEEVKMDFKWLKKWKAQEEYTTFVRRHELGTWALKYYQENAKNGGSVYGLGVVKKMCSLVGLDEGLVYSCVRFADNYTKEQIPELMAMRMKNGKPVSFSHLQAVLAIEDMATRKKVLHQVQNECLSVRALETIVKETHTPSAPKTKGIQGKIKDAMAAVDKIQNIIDIWLVCPDTSLEKWLREAKADELTEAEVEQVQELCKCLDRIRGYIGDSLPKIQKAIERPKAILKGTEAAQEGESEKEEDEGRDEEE